MKKITLLFIFSCFGSFAQTIVSTSPQNKKVILEEFTGVNCVYCPDGHAIAAGIKAARPNDVFLINIHAGNFSTPSAGQPDFRTNFGTALANQSNLTGYPAGTVNRALFTGYSQNATNPGPAMNRTRWSNAANQTLNQPSYVNVATTASMDVNTRVLTVLVEAYYTGNSPVATNKLNVAFLQNNTLGAQTGGGMGNLYNHQHRLVHLITGQWGEDITTTTSGTFVTRTFTYTVPAAYKNIAAEIGNFEVVAFVAETTQNIVSGNGANVTYTGIATNNDAKLKEVKGLLEQCSNVIAPEVVIQNNGQNNLTNLAINYSVNGGVAQTYNWTGNLTSFQTETVVLDAVTFNLENSNTLNISLANDDNNANNLGNTSFGKAVETTTSNITIKIATDAYGTETSWTLKNSQGTTIASRSSYPDQTAAGSFVQPDINLTLPNDCYTFQINDAYGDGMSTTYGAGYYQIHSNGVLIPGMDGGNFGSSETKRFGVANPLSNEEFTAEKISVYPNPSKGFLTINSEMDTDITLFDVSGKKVFSQNQVKNNETINISHLQSGIYFAKLSSDNSNKTIKIILN